MDTNRTIAGLGIAALFVVALSLSPADAGGGSNTRWYSSVNRSAVIVREGGAFRIVSSETGYTLYDDGYCKRNAKSVDPALAKQWNSKLVYFCSRTDKRSDKWAWTEAEFHLLREQGQDVWRLIWVNEREEGKQVPLDAKIKAAKIVPEYPKFDAILDRIDCKVTFERIGDGSELVRPNSPFGDCAAKRVKDGALPPGEYACEPGVDLTFLAKRPVKLINRGSATAPELFLAVQGREPKRCAIEKQ